MDSKSHWEKIYSTKPLNESGWYQPSPEVSLTFIEGLKISKTASIIDAGGGDSYLAEQLLKKGYKDITVLDISEAAINRAKKRMGSKSEKINWLVSDITDLSIDKKFDCWHDRAAFHFMTSKEQIEKYISVAQTHISSGGKLIIGTFSTSGPGVCSGLPVKQYSEQSLSQILKRWFEKIRCITTDHITPFNTIQNFLFCSFKKTTLQ